MLKIILKIGSVGIIDRVQRMFGDEFCSSFATNQYDRGKEPSFLQSSVSSFIKGLS